MVLEQGRKMAALVTSWSVMVMMESCPDDVGRSTMRSIATVENGWAVLSGVIGNKGTAFLFCDGFVLLQTAHPLTYCVR